MQAERPEVGRGWRWQRWSEAALGVCDGRHGGTEISTSSSCSVSWKVMTRTRRRSPWLAKFIDGGHANACRSWMEM
jgi:hypothetical protein